MMGVNIFVVLTSFILTTASDDGKFKQSNFTKPIDLSYNLDENTMSWDLDEKFNRSKIVAGNLIPPDNAWYAVNIFTSPEHIGTHLDAPYHFNPKGGKVADIPLDSLFQVEGKCGQVYV